MHGRKSPAHAVQAVFSSWDADGKPRALRLLDRTSSVAQWRRASQQTSELSSNHDPVRGVQPRYSVRSIRSFVHHPIHVPRLGWELPRRQSHCCAGSRVMYDLSLDHPLVVAGISDLTSTRRLARACVCACVRVRVRVRTVIGDGRGGVRDDSEFLALDFSQLTAPAVP